jgi:deoxyadenosine/deoxycytidine kinase
MRKIILSGVHAVGKTTLAKTITETLKKQGYNTRLYSLDNYVIYRLDDVLSSQIDRIYYGSMKIKEAEEEQPEIAVFDRSLADNVLYSKCFSRFSKLTEEQLTIITRVYQLANQLPEVRKFRLDSTILFLNPSLETIQTNIHARGREKGSILDEDRYIQCLKKMFETHYHNYFDTRMIELTEYTEQTIIETLKKHDIIQGNYQ